MDRDLLKDCVEALKKLLAEKHKELDASVAAELEVVILQLEHCRRNANEDAVVDVELRLRTLEVISRCLLATTNLAEIIRKYFGPE